MMREKKEKLKKAALKKAAKAKPEASHKTMKGTTKTEDKSEKKGMEWPEIMMGMWKKIPFFTAAGDTIEPFMQLAKSQQQHSIELFHNCVDFQLKLHESGRTGDMQKVNEICLELSGEFFRSWQESVKEQTLAFYKFWRNYIPILPGFLEKP